MSEDPSAHKPGINSNGPDVPGHFHFVAEDRTALKLKNDAFKNST
jgi:hypothetical protein